MELLAVLGQYLLLSFVLPGFCYVAVLVLCVPPDFRRRLTTFWLPAGIIGGLLLSSVAFAIEIGLRNFRIIDCEWFPRIPFDRIHDMGSVVNFFAGETFMHLNIGLGTLIILVIFVIYTTAARAWNLHVGIYKLHAAYFALALLVIVTANLTVAGYLFRRVDDIAFNVRDEVGQKNGSGSAAYCQCLRDHPAPDKERDEKCGPLSSSPERILTL